MDKEKFIRIINEEKYLDMSLNIIEKYPNSPFYLYLTEYPIESIRFNDICTNLGFQLNFDQFVNMYHFISNQCHYLDVPYDIKNLMDKFNFIDSRLNSIANQIESNNKILYADILKKSKQIYDKFDTFLSKKNTLLTLNLDEYRMYLDTLANPYIIPVQIILHHEYFSQFVATDEIEKLPYHIQCICIFDGLPLSHVSKNKDDPDIFFLENGDAKYSIGRNMVREQMFNICSSRLFEENTSRCSRKKTRDFGFIVSSSGKWCHGYELDTEDNIVQNFYSDDICTYIDTYLNINTYRKPVNRNLIESASKKYLQNDKIIHFNRLDAKQLSRNIYTIITRDSDLARQMKSTSRTTNVVFGFVHI